MASSDWMGEYYKKRLSPVRADSFCEAMDSDRRQAVSDYLTSLEEEDLFPSALLGEIFR